MKKLKYFPVFFLGLLLFVLPVSGWNSVTKISTHPDNVSNVDKYSQPRREIRKFHVVNVS